MHFYIMTLFPEMFPGIMDASILGRAKTQGLLEWEAVNIRDYTLDKHMKVDDYPYGGGAGMVMQAEPIYRCYEALQQKMKPEPKKKRVIYVTPQGHVFDQKMAEDFAKEEELVFLCGHYEGVDERVLEEIVTDYVSIGDYVLTGGELPAMVMMDTISVLYRECCITKIRQRQRALQTGFWNTRSTRDPKNIMEKKCRKCSCPDIIKTLRRGGWSGHWNVLKSTVRTCMKNICKDKRESL